MRPEDIDRAAAYLAQADALVIAAGAGMGVDSGLPDFRGNAGFWQAYPALGRAAMGFTEVASPRTFRTDPRLAWGFYGHRLALYRQTVPHDGFAILRRWAERLARRAFVFTSNVDGQFQRAGFAEEHVLECHGSIHWLQCTGPCSDLVWHAAGVLPEIDAAACRWRGEELPLCPRCGALARPNILMFGDGAWVEHRASQQEARLASWLRTAARPVVIELGAGTAIASVRRFGEHVVHAHGGSLVRINPREAAVSMERAVGLEVGAREGLMAIDARLGGG